MTLGTLGRTLRSTLDPTLRPSLGGGLPWEQAELLGRRLSLLSGGTFTRSTEGSYLTGAPTDGSAAFLAWAGVDVRRIEDRGDGLGAMLLMEGARTNRVTRSRAQATAPWAGGSATTTVDQNGGPDASTSADRIAGASGQFGNTQAPATSGRVIGSVWVRGVSGTVAHQMVIYEGGTIVPGLISAPSTAYVRCVTSSFTAGAAVGAFAMDGRDWSGSGGQVATAQDVYVDLIQVENGYFPTSAIRTVAAAVTRGAERLNFAAGLYPDSFRTRGFRITVVPDFSSSEGDSTVADFGIASMSAGIDILRLRCLGTHQIQFYSNGVLQVSQAITWARGTVITFTVEPSAGRLTVAGALTGNGVYTGAGGAWGTGTTLLDIGTDTGSAPFFGRISQTLVGL